MNFVLYLLGVLLILLPLWVNATLPAIASVIAGFILIIFSSLSSVVNIIPSKKVEKVKTSEESLVKKISKIFINFNQEQLDSLKDTIQITCSHVIPDISEKINVSQDKIKYFLELIKNDTKTKELLGKKEWEIFLGRKNDVELVGSIYLDLKESLEKSQNDKELNHNILKVINRSSETWSLNDFISCPESPISIISSLDELRIEKNTTKFVENIIRQRVGVPHYESTIFAFSKVRHFLASGEIKQSIDKDLSEKILSDYFNLLLNELKLRNIIIEYLEKTAEMFIRREITFEDAHELIKNTLNIYAKTISLSRQYT